MFVYGVLYWLIFRAVNVGRKTKVFLLPLILTVIYALSDEFHQSLIPHRTPTLRDIGFDSVGILIVMARLKGII